MHVKFGVIADLHVDIMPDGAARMQGFCEEAVRWGAEFLIHLGDMQYPEAEFLREADANGVEKAKQHSWFFCDRDDEKLEVKRLLRETGLPMYGVLGNHDMDACSKKATCRYWGMPSPYYSFVRGGLRFIALDTNHIVTEDGVLDFEVNNYRYYPGAQLSYLTSPQLKWLEEEILRSEEPCVLLSHAPLGDDLLCTKDRQEVWKILERVNADRRRVIFALNGHNHIDGMSVRRGVPFISINSASNIWIGHRYDAIRYSETISRLYPHIKGCAPYRDALFAFFEIDDETIRMTGRKTGFVGPSPQQLGFPKSGAYHEPVPYIRDRVLPVAAMEGDGKIMEEDIP